MCLICVRGGEEEDGEETHLLLMARVEREEKATVIVAFARSALLKESETCMSPYKKMVAPARVAV